MKVYSSYVDLKVSNNFVENLAMPHNLLQQMTYRTQHDGYKQTNVLNLQCQCKVQLLSSQLFLTQNVDNP